MGLPAFAFDSLEFVKELEVGGISRVQAEAHTHALSKVFEANIKELATKDHLQAVETNLRGEIVATKNNLQTVENNLRGEIVATKNNLRAVETNLRCEIADLRKDMDCKFAIVDTKLNAIEANLDARFTTVDTKFAAVDAKFDKLASQMTVRLGSIVLAAFTIMPFILKLLHTL